MKITKLAFSITLFILILSSFTALRTSSINFSETTVFSDSFEYNTIPSNYIYSVTTTQIPITWTISSTYAKNGTNSINSPFGDWNTGSFVLNNKSLVNSSVSSWIYMSGTNDLSSGLAVRSDSTNCSIYGHYDDICNGYILRFGHTYQGVDSPVLKLYRSDNGNLTTLAVYQLGYWFSNTWMNIKLVANGSILEGFVGNSVNMNLVINYNTSNDLIQYSSGRSGFGTRLAPSPYSAYFDLVSIDSLGTSSPYQINDSFENPSIGNNWLIANHYNKPAPWAISSLYAKDGTNSINSPFGNWTTGSYVLYNKSMVNSSVSSWIYMSGTNDLMSGLAIRSNGVNCSIYESNYADICNGYILRFEHNRLGVSNPELVLARADNGNITTLSVYQLSSWWMNTWMHLKLVAVGSMIVGYVSNQSTFSSPVITYNTSSDSIQYNSGFSGFGTRLAPSPFSAYFDSFTINNASISSSSQTQTSSKISPITTNLGLIPMLFALGALIIIRKNRKK